MLLWLRRVWREWPVMAWAVATSLFGVNDAVDALRIGGADQWLFLLAFIIFAVVMLFRLVQLQARLDDRLRDTEGLRVINQAIIEGNKLLEEYGRPGMHISGNPMVFQIDGIRRIGEWMTATFRALETFAPDYTGHMANIGDVYHDTNAKPAMIQQLEKHLRSLGDIATELRRKI